MEGGYYIPEKDLITMPIRYMQEIDKLAFYQEIDNAAYTAALEYCKIFPAAAENITGFSSKHFVKYLPGSFMGPHSDCSISYKDETLEPKVINSIGNTVSMSIILNDTFTGGEMNFKLWDINVSPKAGSALLYPSNYIGAHEVSEVTSGVRWVFLGFLYHGDRSFTINPEIEKYSERYEWTTKFRQILTDFFKHHKKGNLNRCQKKVL
jgi:predicted 2-oxoglutarate/Fe(II)-dependent dioxygenase YbiX